MAKENRSRAIARISGKARRCAARKCATCEKFKLVEFLTELTSRIFEHTNFRLISESVDQPPSILAGDRQRKLKDRSVGLIWRRPKLASVSFNNRTANC
jgi:hypothetical protein